MQEVQEVQEDRKSRREWLVVLRTSLAAEIAKRAA
jgi:hypothetical protein